MMEVSLPLKSIDIEYHSEKLIKKSEFFGLDIRADGLLHAKS
ncbi:hypothetical protein SAMN04488024_10532 [Pedobacter soli]|uniref:Uncharacterized protein n=1 Tax=Pedobacter soli TaxID=390242 RepID=A0A1G6TKZ5_9SPHI|nr:hypothetical protein SAMN04488024_10532 [Pedobacter soli]